MRRTLVLVLTLSLSLLGAACGGDDDGGERLSQEEFETQANEICSAGNERLDEAFENSGFGEDEPPPADDVEAFIQDEVVPSIEQQIEDLRGLNPPEDVEDDFEALLEDADAALDTMRDMSGEEILNEEEDPFADVNARSEELGLTACAEG